MSRSSASPVKPSVATSSRNWAAIVVSGLIVVGALAMVLASQFRWQSYDPSFPFDEVSTADHWSRIVSGLVGLLLVPALWFVAGRFRRLGVISALVAAVAAVPSVVYLGTDHTLTARAGPEVLRAIATTGPWVWVSLGGVVAVSFGLALRWLIARRSGPEH